MSWAEVVYRIAMRLITSGYGLPLVFGTIFVASLWVVTRKMSSNDTRDLILGIANSRFWAILGWALFLAASVLYRIAFRFQKQSYERQFKTMEEVKNKALELQSKLPLEIKNPEEK